MKRVLVGSIVVFAGVSATKAHAQEVRTPNYFEQELAAPAGAFEIGASGFWNQAWGNITDDQSSAFVTTPSRKVQDVSGPGLSGELDLGWRFSPHWVAGVFGTYTGYRPDDVVLQSTDVRSVTAGLQAQFFLRPYHMVNPWIGIGSAWRGFWIVPDVGGITSRQGWELARLMLGADIRPTREFSLGPYAAGGLDVMFGEKVPGEDWRNLSGPPVSVFVSAGLMGRFDIGGTYIQHAGQVASR